MCAEPEPNAAVWRKSSHSGPGGTCCVEVRQTCDHVCVRDSKDPDGAILAFERASWEAFIESVKRGELDAL